MDKAKLVRIPDSPGVYIFKDKKDNILYIGKARSLKKRVRNYFTRPQSFKIQVMSSKIADLDYIITKSEAQARLEEAKLIKENLPPYNTVFRDDKSFPLICISNEDFPVVWLIRKTSTFAKARLRQDFGGCPTKLVKRSRASVDSGVRRKTGKRLGFCVSRYFGPYTNAGLLREGFKLMRHIFGFRSCLKMPRRSCLYYRLGLCPAPCIGKISVGGYKEIIRNIILFLEGKQEDLINKLSIKMHRLADEKKFEQAAQVRNQIQALSSLSPHQYIGGGGIFKEGIPSLSDSYRESAELKEALGLDIRPRRIEAFDVSNIFGSSACASMVSFYEGKPDKDNYRRFRIKGVLGIDDCRMLEEAVSRRYRRLLDENLALPDLIIIDGGRGQLNKVSRKLKELGLTLPVISIAKPSKTRDSLSTRQREKLFISHQQASILRLRSGLALSKAEGPIRLKTDSLGALRLIQRIRDEAHRFALAYHRVLRRKKTLGR
ncbi:MAG: excinuclease ABC subunit UvrC [Candidatus Omnitrophica bacterium]|nr:excinuclease ABC subunit UvrC [Candidatus Omnitrophota bacterium]